MKVKSVLYIMYNVSLNKDKNKRTRQEKELTSFARYITVAGEIHSLG